MDSLYELTNDYLTLMEYADSTDPDDEQVFIDTLDGLVGTIENKIDNCAAVMSHMEAHKNMLEKEIERLQAKYNAIDNNQERIKRSIYMAMVAMNKRKISTDLHTFSIRGNGGKKPLTICGEVPDKYQKVIYEPDKALIRKELEAGKELDFAFLADRGEYLHID